MASRGEAIAFARAAVAISTATDALLDHADARPALAAALRRRRQRRRGRRRGSARDRALGGEGCCAARRAGTAPRPDRDPALRAPVDRVETATPTRRRVGTNAATANIDRVGAAIAARNVDEYLALLADDYVGVHHATALTYDRAASLARLRALFESKDLAIGHEPLATLGDTLALFRWSISSSGAAGETFDVGPYEHESIDLIEVDGHTRRRRFEQFANDRLGDAIARLYQRYTEILPDGPARIRATATAHAVAAHMAPFDLERLATVFAPDIEVVDHRTVGFGTLRGVETLVRAVRALLDLVDGFGWRVDDVLGLDANLLLVRHTSFRTERVGGGAFERTLCELWIFGADGKLARWERFDVEHAAAALARFDALVGSAPAEQSLRLVRPNAATAHAARSEAAFAADDTGAIAALWTDGLEVIDHQNGTAYGRDAHLDSIRRLQRGRDPRMRFEPLASLDASLGLTRRRIEASGQRRPLRRGRLRARGGRAFREQRGGRCSRVEIFAAARLGAAVARLYERRAELVPDGPQRTRAVATARAVAAMVAPPDLDRYAAALAPDVAFVDHRTVGFASGRGADSLLRGFRSLLDLADDITTRVEDVLRLEPDAVLLRWTITGTDRATGGAFESEFLLLWVFGSDGRVVHDETFDAGRTAEAAARFDALVGGAAPYRPSTSA